MLRTRRRHGNLAGRGMQRVRPTAGAECMLPTPDDDDDADVRRRVRRKEHLDVGLFLGVLNKYPVVSTGEEHVRPAAAVNIQRHAAVVNTTINAATPA